MNKILKINATGTVIQFFERYRIWKDYCKFYKNSENTSLAEMAQDGIPCFWYKDIKDINSSSSNLVAIDCGLDGIHCMKDFKKYNKQKKYILFCNGTWDQEYHQIGIDYVLVHNFYVLYLMADAYTSPNRFCYYLDKNYDFDCEKPFIFVSTIGNVRNKRNIFVSKLTESIKHKNYILRYSGEDYGSPSHHLDVLKFEPGEFDPYIDILPEYYHNVSQSLPMSMYNSARFNIAVETDIAWQNSFFLTEKTVKVLLTGMPFVSVSTTNFLSNLRSLGFETYHSLWDESYDQETDWLKRFDKIVALCNNLCDFDWESHRDQLEKIKYKNQTNFLNLNTIINREFENFENTISKLL